MFSAEEQAHLFAAEGLPAAGNTGLISKLSRARFIGSFINKFLLFECDKSLFVVDQHAAQERIAFEKLMIQMEKNTVEVQHLLSPITLKISLQEAMAWEESKGKMEEIGFSSSLFDAETLAIHSYPILLKNPEPAVRYLLAGENISHCDHETIARRACRSSVMAGDYLNKEKAEFQRDQLIKCRDPFTCPHGRPTVVEMNEKFLDKQFLRT
jgi:DNA mismatch repair protein MutL